MRLLTFRPAAIVVALVHAGLLTAAITPNAGAQQLYKNIVNTHFRTVGDGPQSAIIADAPIGSDAAAVHRAALAAYNIQANLRRPALTREVAFLRQKKKIRANQQLGLVDFVYVRENGRLALPPILPGRAAAQPNAAGRASGPPAVNLTLNFTVGTAAGQWDLATANTLSGLANQIIPLVQGVMGNPIWTPTAPIQVLNLDPNEAVTSGVIGALVEVAPSGITVDFPSFTTPQDQFLQMAMIVAQLFHGPNRIGYDAWEQGMSRAVAVIVAQEYQQANGGFGGSALDPANDFFYASEYDMDNQQPLANSTFTPPTLSSMPLNNSSLAGMLVPRLRMSSTAWLKCYIQNNTFFVSFNTNLYNGFTADPTVLNNVPDLEGYAAAALNNSIEGQPFDAWFTQQYVLDTAVTPGPKLYADVTPTFPDSTTTPATPGGASVVLVYYQTTSTGDENDNVSGTCNPIYWSYNLVPLNLNSGPISITGGLGFDAPFFLNLGGTPSGNFSGDQMRLTIDYPVNKEVARVVIPANQTGSETTPNDFSGVFVGADQAAVNVIFGDGQQTTNMPAYQGEFGGVRPAASVSQHAAFFSKDQIQVVSGTTTYTFYRNVFHRSQPTDPSLPGVVAPVWEFVVPMPVASLSTTIPAGPQMISFPLRPLATDLAAALGVSPTTLLLAEYRADIASPPALDQYLRYPSLPLYQPGYGMWSNFPSSFTFTVTGESEDAQGNVSVPLLPGWNQIGSPYSAGITQASTTNANPSNLQFSSNGNGPEDYASAVQDGSIAAGVFYYDAVANSYVDITQEPDPNNTAQLQDTLLPWYGYWVRVLGSGGVTLTYNNTNAASRAVKALLKTSTRAVVQTRPRPDPGAWRVPLTLSDANGHRAVAAFGQSSRGSDSFVSSLDAANPPLLTRSAATLGVLFPHTDWPTGVGTSGGGFLSDIRKTGGTSQWNVAVTVPQGAQSYTLSWGNTATVPRGTRLTLTDTTSGTQRSMNSTASYVFTPTKGETTRMFQISSQPHATVQLAVSNMYVDQFAQRAATRAISTATIHYELSTDADVSVEIQLNGRTVRHLAAATRAAVSGDNQVVWDLKDDYNRPLGTGAYILKVQAQTSDGTSAQSILPFLITR